MCKILVVDNDEKTLDEACEVLDHEGFNDLLCATSGQEGYEKIMEFMDEIKLILLRNKLPDMNGMDLCQEVSSKLKNTIIILYSGTLENPVLEFVALSVGAKAWLPKDDILKRGKLSHVIDHWFGITHAICAYEAKHCG